MMSIWRWEWVYEQVDWPKRNRYKRKRSKRSFGEVNATWLSLHLAGRIFSLACTQALDSVTTFRLYELYRSLCCPLVPRNEHAIFENSETVKTGEKKMNVWTTWEAIWKNSQSWFGIRWPHGHFRTHTQHTDTSVSHSKPIHCFLLRLWTIYMDLYRDVCGLPHRIMPNIMCIRCASGRKWHPEKRFNVETRRNTLAPMEKT